MKAASVTVNAADLPVVKAEFRRLQAEIDMLRGVLDEIYPSLAGRYMHLRDANEDRAAAEWRDICHKVAATWPKSEGRK